MNHSQKLLAVAGVGGLLALQLAACGGTSTTSAPAAQQPTAVAAPTAAANSADASSGGAVAPSASISLIAEVRPVQDANLTFQTTGTISQVLVKEGDQVKKDQLLAVLDTRSFDEKVNQAQAALQVAQAQLQSAQAQQQVAGAARQALSDPPKPALLQAARAQVQAAQVAVKQAQTGQGQNVVSAQAGLTAAQDTAQSTKDKLSRAKTSAEAAVEQSALSLQQAQASYATAKSNWDYVQETGKNPVQPNTVNGQGKAVANKVTDAQREQYYAVFVQAEAALRQAEQRVDQTQVDAQQARQAEVIGVEAADQQVTQAQAVLGKVAVPPDQDAVAAANAGLALAQANLAALQPDPRPSDKSRVVASAAAAEAGSAAAQANVAQAQAAVEQAQLSRSYAELHAPYDGEIAQVNVDPSDSSVVVGQPAIRLLDLSKLRVEVPVGDADITRVQVGQAVQMQSNALDKTYTGTVSYVAPEATSNGTTRTYLVRIDFDQPTDLRPGMQVTVNIGNNR